MMTEETQFSGRAECLPLQCLPARSISVTVNQAIGLITDSVRGATGSYRNQNRLETATHWNDRDRQRKQKSPHWWLMVCSLWTSLCQPTIRTTVLHIWHFRDQIVGWLSCCSLEVIRMHKRWMSPLELLSFALLYLLWHNMMPLLHRQQMND